MKKHTPLFLSLPIISALMIGLVSMPVTAQDLPPGPLAISTGYLIMTKNVDTVVQIAPETISNHGSLFYVDSNKIFIAAPFYRVSVQGNVSCTNGNHTYYQIASVARFGNNASIANMQPVVVVRHQIVGTTSTDFGHIFRRDFTDTDWANGDPYFQVLFRHNANLDISCKFDILVRAE